MMKQVYRNTLLLCIFTILVAFIMKLFGYEGFHIPAIDNHVNNNLIIISICYALLYTINGILLIILVVKRKLNKKELIIFLAVIILYYITSLFISYNYLKIIIECLIIVIFALLYTKKPIIIIESLIMYGINLVYQIISMKTKGLIIQVMNISFTTSIVLQIDYYMMMLISVLYFLKKGEHIYELVYKIIRKIRRRSIPILGVLSKRNCEEKCLQQNQENVFEVGYFIFNIVLFIFQALLILTICYFIKNTLLNVILIFISFTVLRKTFGKSYHADTIIKCTTLSAVLFITATELSLDINISLLSSIIIGVFLAYAMHVYYFYDNYVKCNNDITKLNINELRVKLYYLSETEVNMLYEYWHRDNNETVEDIADRYGYNKMKIYRTIRKIKENNL